MRAFLVAPFLLCSSLAHFAFAATVYDEGSGGDLSTSNAAPTALGFALGSNQVSGTTGRSVAGGPIDRDYFTFTIPANAFLYAVTVLPGTTTGGTGLGFLGIGSGTTMIDPTLPGGTVAASLLGYSHYNNSSDIGNSILPTLAASNTVAPPAIGFSQLGPGAYSVWIQETSVGSFAYSLDFVIATVPEPSTWAMLLTGFAGLAAFRRSR